MALKDDGGSVVNDRFRARINGESQMSESNNKQERTLEKRNIARNTIGHRRTNACRNGGPSRALMAGESP